MASQRATEKDSTQAIDLPSQQDSELSVCESVRSVHAVTDSGHVVHRPALHCKPTPAQLGIGGVDDVMRPATPSSTASLERQQDPDLDDATTTTAQ